MSRYPDALRGLEQALAIFREVKDREDEAVALQNIGALWRRLGRYEKSAESLAQSLPIRREVGDRRGEAVTLDSIGVTRSSLGRYDEALEYHDRALTIFRDVKDLNNQGLSLMRSGDALQGMGRHAEELAQHPALFEGVDLLSLSACDTAVAGGEQGGGELEGFGMLAQRQGAKSVLATLWSVEDQSTRQIMAEFYRLRQAAPEKPKAEALRQAQLALLQGKRSAAMMQARRSAAPFAGEARERPPSDVRKGLYAHPYFWAPFVLIGNWR